MAEPTGSERVHGYCGRCIARCGCLAAVEDGPFTPASNLTGTTAVDSVSGTAPHRSYLCEIRRAA
jgi:hypothetical protein